MAEEKRNFPDFIDAYFDWAKDNYCPDVFHLWTGISIVASALERKVCLNRGGKDKLFPNIYTMLVAKPATGKSTAMRRGVKLLEEVEARRPYSLAKFPDHITVAKMIDVMTEERHYQDGTTMVFHASKYFYCSEASNAFKECQKKSQGTFFNLLTDWYDCPDRFSKALAMWTEEKTIRNVCVNILAGGTYAYLKELLGEESLGGGFASRLIFVVGDSSSERQATLGIPLVDAPADESRIEEAKSADPRREQLIQDLDHINRIVGEFKGTTEFAQAYQKWFQACDKEIRETRSENMQHLLARVQTNALKLAMIFSVSRSDELIFRLTDWERAVAVMEAVTEELPKILLEGSAKNTRSQSGLNAAVLNFLSKKGEAVTERELEQYLILSSGFSTYQVRDTLQLLKRSPELVRHSVVGRDSKFELIANPNDHI